jgi:hypothetical protein
MEKNITDVDSAELEREMMDVAEDEGVEESMRES